MGLLQALRIPRSGSMIFTMFLALIATILLPFVFMLALATSTDAQRRPLTETLKEMGRPLALGVERVLSRLR